MSSSTTLTYTSIGDLFEQLLGDIRPTPRMQKLYPHFHIRLGVVKYRPPRHEFFDFIRDMGAPDVPHVLEHEPLGKDVLTFVFPERWMGVQEAVAFMSRLAKHPDVLADKIKQVDILTRSPFIVGDFLKEAVLILTFGDSDNAYNCVNRWRT